jgi:crotonobetainyl-CoA:carnitine CoA-transferase CaiB-like acyl-CoA transferase
MTLPLADVTVVALEQAISAPLCTRHLADLGARVIKIESIHGGDFARDYDDVVNGLSAHFAWLNRNKESVAIDVKSDGGRAILERLLSRADVVIQNLAPGAAARLGVDAVDVVRRFPAAVAVDISGYGQGGPLDDRRAYDLLVQAEAGSCAITGWPDALAKSGIPVADIGAGMYALSSILAALVARGRTGVGAAISVSLFDVVAEWMGFALNQTRYTGSAPVPNGIGSPMVAPYGAYPTLDGQTVVLGTTNNAEFTRLAQMIRAPGLLELAELANNAGRVTHRAHIDAAVASWTSARSLGEIQAAADAAGIGHARLNQVQDVITHPQLTNRGRWVDVDSPGGRVTCLLAPPVVAAWPSRMDPIPALGEHTAGVLEWLGVDATEMDTLLDARVIALAPTATP